MSAYTKAFLAMLGAVVTGFVTVLTDNVIEPVELVNLGLAAVGAFAVYVTPNVPGYSAAKAGVVALTAALQYLVGVIELDTFSLDRSVWMQLLVTGATAAFVWFAPNKPAVTSSTV